MAIKMTEIRNDLLQACSHFPTSCLRHVVTNRGRLIRRAYSDGTGGCLFHLLSETLPPERRIDSKSALTRFFTGQDGAVARELPEYQPARWLVRAIDGDICATVRGRYGDLDQLDWDLVIEVLQEEIDRRERLERAAHVAPRAKRVAKIAAQSGAELAGQPGATRPALKSRTTPTSRPSSASVL